MSLGFSRVCVVSVLLCVSIEKARPPRSSDTVPQFRTLTECMSLSSHITSSEVVGGQPSQAVSWLSPSTWEPHNPHPPASLVPHQSGESEGDETFSRLWTGGCRTIF